MVFRTYHKKQNKPFAATIKAAIGFYAIGIISLPLTAYFQLPYYLFSIGVFLFVAYFVRPVFS
jgi:hypothetical protein